MTAVVGLRLRLEALERREAVAVVARVSEQEFGRLRALEKEADLLLVGHTDATVYLDRHPGHAIAGFGCPVLRERGEEPRADRVESP